MSETEATEPRTPTGDNYIFILEDNGVRYVVKERYKNHASAMALCVFYQELTSAEEKAVGAMLKELNQAI